MSIIGLLISAITILPTKNLHRHSRFQLAVMSANDELYDNAKCLDRIRRQLEGDLNWPVCRQTHTAIDKLFRDHFYDLSRLFYGEDNTLLWQWKEIDSTIDAWNVVEDTDQLRLIEQSSLMSIGDLYFQQAFLIWYLSVHIDASADSAANFGSITPEFYTHIPDALWEKWPPKLTINYDNKKAITFGDWLALLD